MRIVNFSVNSSKSRFSASADIKAIARSRSNSREPIKEAKTIFSDLPAQLTPSTREAMAVAKEGKKMAASITATKDQPENAPQEENAEKSAIEEKMNEIGTN